MSSEISSELLQRTMASLQSIKVKNLYGDVFYSYVPTRQVFLAGQRRGLTQEQFAEKRRQSFQKMGELFERIRTPKAKGYMKVKRAAGQELCAIMDWKPKEEVGDDGDQT